jgi:hypothetical protein
MTLAVCALAAISALAQGGLTGTWQIEYHDKNGKEVDYPMITFLQNGSRLEGVFGNKHWRVQGAIDGNRVEFAFHPPQRPDVTVRYQGTIDNANQLRGTMASEVQSGTFVATRQP